MALPSAANQWPALLSAIAMKMKKAFPKQVIPLAISFVTIAVISYTMKRFGETKGEENELALMQQIPDAPPMASWPEELRERLEIAYLGLIDNESRRDSLRDVAFLYDANGYRMRARQCYAMLQALDPHSTDWLYHDAVTYLDYRDPTEAIAKLQSALERKPEEALFHYRLGEAYSKVGNWESAVASYQSAIALQPDNPWAQLGLGRASNRLGDFETARDAFESAQDGDDPLVAAMLELQAMEETIENWEAAKALQARIDGYTDVSERFFDPQSSVLGDYCYNVPELCFYAEGHIKRGEYEEALDLLQRAAGLDGREARIAELSLMLADKMGVDFRSSSSQGE